MTENQAIKKYLSKRHVAMRVIHQIMKWREDLTAPENGRLIGVTAPNAFALAKEYDLKYVVVGKGNYLR